MGPEALDLFIVLRNAEDLPEGLSGTDLDLSTMPGAGLLEVTRYLTRQAQKAGWHALAVSRRPHMVGLSLVHAASPVSLEALHFDVFAGISYLGIPLLTPEDLAEGSQVRGGVRHLSPSHRVLATVLHHLSWSGGLSKTKYRQELLDLQGARPPWLEAQLSRVHSRLLAELVARPWDIPTGPSRRTRLILTSALALQRLRKEPGRFVTALSAYLVGQIPSLIRPPGKIGRPGDLIPDLSVGALDLRLACRICPLAAQAPSVRAPASCLRTLNGPRYESALQRTWQRWSMIRWLVPTAFLWFQAKRNRIVLLESLPLGIRFLRRLPTRPSWISSPQEG